jgi:putative CocE/NonD family hydrolase
MRAHALRIAAIGGLILSLPLLPLIIPGSSAFADDPFDVKAHYEKHEYQIPMRDGVKLFTSVYAPKDSSQDYPLLMSRTPYSVGPYGESEYRNRLAPSPRFAKEGYIFVFQDVRGRYKSEGHFVHMTPHKDIKRGPADVDESTDTYDTIDWLIKNIPHNNGRVGIYGISYPGFFTAAGIIDAHPALKAASPQAPQGDWFMGDDCHHNGAFFLTSTFNFMSVCGMLGTGTSMSCGAPFNFGGPDEYKFFLEMGPLSNADAKYFHGQSPGWTEMMEHGTYDQFWKDRNLLTHLRTIKPAIMSVGGWYDANNFYGALHVFESIEQQSPGTQNILVVGPWSHGQWSRGDGDSLAQLRFDSKTSEFFRENIEFPFFDYHLKGKVDPKLPKAYVFETGSNKWRTYDSWPLNDTTARSIYLRDGGALSFDPPRDSAKQGSIGAFDEYVSDPAHPVPFMPGFATDMNPDYMAQDQRFAAARPDVLVYQSAPLDADVTIAGPIVPSLYVSSTGTDSDWVVKLIDVYPEDTPAMGSPGGRRGSGTEGGASPGQRRGLQELVRGDVVRAKFRNSFEKPEPLIPGKPTRVEMTMPDVLHTFPKGHRIMVQIQSSWFPLVDRNPQKFVDIYKASASDFQKATERVYRSGSQASRIQVNVLRKAE